MKTTLLMAAAGVALGWLLTNFAALRSLKQPVPYRKNDEELVLAFLANGGDRAALKLDDDAFLHPARRLYLAEDVPASESDSDALAPDEAIINAVSRLNSDAFERRELSGSAGWDVVDAEPPYVRVKRRSSILRYVSSMLACGAGCAVSAWLVTNTTYMPGADLHLAVLALCAIVASGVVIALVDIDTLYLDLWTIGVGGGAAWFLTAFYLHGNGQLSSLKYGVFAALSWGVALQVINFIYLLIRKQAGMGFGDIIIITMTAGVPSALAGDAAVGFIGVVASFVRAVVYQLPLAIKRNSGGRTAFALGPYLCSGWIVAWVALNYAGLVR